MYESDTESPVARRKRLEVDSQHPSVLNEYIKCVVVGDSGVGRFAGKSHLFIIFDAVLLFFSFISRTCNAIPGSTSFGSPHDKTTMWHVQPAKTQISLSSLVTGRMPRLI